MPQADDGRRVGTDQQISHARAAATSLTVGAFEATLLENDDTPCANGTPLPVRSAQAKHDQVDGFAVPAYRSTEHCSTWNPRRVSIATDAVLRARTSALTVPIPKSPKAWSSTAARADVMIPRRRSRTSAL